MTEEEANLKDYREGSTPFQYPDEPEPREPDFSIERKALQFYEDLILSSRTLSAAKVRVVASKVLMGDLTVAEAARKLGITKRQVFRAVEELKKARGLR
jgi:hypothetical protein